MAGKLAVVLSGGGAKGAFQVGVLDALIVGRGVRIDIFAGVSTGAIQALAGAMDDVPGLVEAWLLSPPVEFSDTLEFDPAKIRAAIDAGRAAVEDQWPALGPFLGST